tara:strand:+ start:2081 stop:3148 length:1068 start_codon:yes stop_codon:yes gene_type:complete
LKAIYSLLLPAIRIFPPEFAHNITIRALTLGLGPSNASQDDSVLATSVWGLSFRNPVGLSAGFDKGAEVPDAMLRAGFGFVEAGTVTPLPQSGNQKPRVFRLNKDRAAINRLGFNGTGLAPFLGRICRRKKGLGPFGANVGRNKLTKNGVADYEIGIQAVAPYADYLVANISSPNTPGLRAMQARARLEEMILRVLHARARAIPDQNARPPLIIKIAPDLTESEREDIAQVILTTGVDGLTVANTSIMRPKHLTGANKKESGGLSGVPLFPIALRLVADMYQRTGGNVPIIGCGGIASGEDAYAMIKAGASLVQLYTAMALQGPQLISNINSELAFLLKRDGFASIKDAVGIKHL